MNEMKFEDQWGGPGLLHLIQDALRQVESLPSSTHATRLSSLLSDAAFGLRRLQQSNDHHWPQVRVLVTGKMVDRLAKFIATTESRGCKTLDESLYHQSKWERIVPEARAMLDAACNESNQP